MVMVVGDTVGETPPRPPFFSSFSSLYLISPLLLSLFPFIFRLWRGQLALCI